MTIDLAILAFVAGMIFLYKGSDILIDGTSKTAAQLGVSSFIISVIIVAFGTSAPEFAISFGAAIQHYPGISLGNIVGSCIANLLLILGISSLIRPIPVKKNIVHKEIPMLIVVTIIFVGTSLIGLLDEFHWVGGIIYLILFIIFIIYFLRTWQRERKYTNIFQSGSLQKNILFIIVGIAGVVAGSWLLIESAIAIARFLAISEIIIALSIVAIGTSLPELVVSVAASYKQEFDIVAGNIIGSNVFNIFLVIGASALLIPLDAIDSLNHLLFLLVITFIIFPLLYNKYAISRIKGVFLLILYFIFIWYIFFI
jgi:cation:H+ antiporter